MTAFLLGPKNKKPEDKNSEKYNSKVCALCLPREKWAVLQKRNKK